jgi:hypothetical protein
MAMTKKEKAEMQTAKSEMQAAINRAEALAALRWTAPVRPDLDVPEKGYSEGWDYNSYSQSWHCVFTSWSGPVSHGTGPAPTEGNYSSATKGARRLFSTEALALAAMRHDIELKAAADLLKIDRQIAATQQIGEAT